MGYEWEQVVVVDIGRPGVANFCKMNIHLLYKYVDPPQEGVLIKYKLTRHQGGSDHFLNIILWVIQVFFYNFILLKLHDLYNICRSKYGNWRTGVRVADWPHIGCAPSRVSDFHSFQVPFSEKKKKTDGCTPVWICLWHTHDLLALLVHVFT